MAKKLITEANSPFLNHINNTSNRKISNPQIVKRPKKYTKGFMFFNPIMNVMLITSCVVAILYMSLTEMNKEMVATFGFTITMLIQFYILFPAWIAFGRDCKYKEFILFACIFFVVPIALIWALVGEKKEYDYPVL